MNSSRSPKKTFDFNLMLSMRSQTFFGYSRLEVFSRSKLSWERIRRNFIFSSRVSNSFKIRWPWMMVGRMDLYVLKSVSVSSSWILFNSPFWVWPGFEGSVALLFTKFSLFVFWNFLAFIFVFLFIFSIYR